MKDNRYMKLTEFAKELLNKRSLEEGLPLIAKYVKDVIDAQRCSIFIYDDENNELWTTISDGIDKIVIPADKGIVGYTLKVKKPVVTNDPYSHEAFLSKIDHETGFITTSIITAPIFDSNRNIIGILELLNKEGGFDDEDVKFMIFFAHYISGFLELLKSYLKQEDMHEKV